jgi:hypothetical protein
VFREVIESLVAPTRATWVSFELATTARHIDLTMRDDGRGVYSVLSEQWRLPSARDAAEALARGRSSGSPGARLLLLARGAERFSMTSSGVSYEFDAAGGAWRVQDVAAPISGTSITLRVRRAVPRIPDADAAPTLLVSRR